MGVTAARWPAPWLHVLLVPVDESCEDLALCGEVTPGRGCA